LDEFIEEGVSGRTADRPSLRALLSRCQSGTPKVEVVLVHKVDRLSRNLADYVAIRQILRNHGVGVASVVEGLDESNSGRLVEHILASLAEFYSANLSDEVKKGLTQKVQQGGWPHQLPFGYQSLAGHVLPDPTTAPIVREAFERYGRGGTTLPVLSRHVNVPVSTLQRWLRNPFHTGQLRWKGSLYPGAHQPIVPHDLFEQVQRLLDARRRRRAASSASNLWLRGFAKCGTCGRLMSSEVHGAFGYYRCRGTARQTNRCRARYCNAARADQWVRTIFERIPLTPALRRYVRLQLADQRAGEIRAVREQQRFHKETRIRLDKRAVVLATSFADGVIVEDVYRLAAERLRAERAALEAAMQSMSPVNREPNVDLRRARTLAEMSDRLSMEQRQQLLTIVFETLTLTADRIISYQLKPPFDVLDTPRIAA
jgi:DNA invertase Pin-like site-specific DNA recombinase